MNRRAVIFILLLALLAALFAPVIYAHGLNIQYRAQHSYEIYAAYDNGEPMKEGQVTVYAPDNPSQPWLQDMTDQDGRFLFVPDAEKEGDWIIRFRQAGHGEMITISSTGRATGSTGFSAAQLILMAGSMLWGCVGTALYFKGRRQ